MASVTTVSCLFPDAFLPGLSQSCQGSNTGDLGSSDAKFVFKARRIGRMLGTRLSALWHFDSWCIFAPCSTASIKLGSLVVLSPISVFLLLPALLDATVTEDVRLKKSEEATRRNPNCGVPAPAVESKDLRCAGSLDTSCMALAWGIRVVDEVRLILLKFGELPSRFAS